VEKAKNKTAEKETELPPNDEGENSSSQLVVKSYVDAIMDRTKLLLYVTMAADDPTTPLTSDYKGTIVQGNRCILILWSLQSQSCCHQLLVHPC